MSFFPRAMQTRPVYLVCGDALAVMEKVNLECPHSAKHAKLDELKGKARLNCHSLTEFVLPTSLE